MRAFLKGVMRSAHGDMITAQHGADLFGLRAVGNIYSRVGNPTVVRILCLCAIQDVWLLHMGLLLGSI
jgi:hypothetical protein